MVQLAVADGARGGPSPALTNLMGTLCRALEVIIDNVVKTGESNKGFAAWVEKFTDQVNVCPRFLADRFGRIY